MKRLILSALLASSFVHEAAAQVGINTTSPDSTALLDIRYSGQGSSVGVMLPHLDAAARQQVKSRVSDGMLVFDRDEKQLYYYDGKKGEWVTATPFGAIRHENGFGDIRPQDAAVNGLNLGLGLPASETAKAKLDVNGNARVRGNIKVEGSDTVQQNLLVKGTTTLQQSLQVNGNTILQQALTVNGNTTLQSPTAINSTLTVSGNISAGNSTVTAQTFVGNGTIPVGGIIMWSGITPPAGWALCDGTSGTPNLKGRFIVGYDPASSQTPSNVTTGKQENYGKIKNTGGEVVHTLSINEMPSHTHGPTSAKFVLANGTSNADSGGTNRGLDEVSRAYSSQTTATGGDQSHENRPPYYVLAFIMRVQ